jgi:leucyl-tRNA synthetase
MTGHNVLHCLGYDAFGLPAEQYAVQTGQHPRNHHRREHRQHAPPAAPAGAGPRRPPLHRHHRPGFYRWTQWIFLQIFNAWFDDADGGRGRARPIAELVAEFAPVTRSPPPDGRAWADLTTRAAARRGRPPPGLPVRGPGQLVPGAGHGAGQRGGHRRRALRRGNFPVFKRNMRQWMMRITAYADRLIDDLDRLDWPSRSS